MKSVNVLYLLCSIIVIAGCSFAAKQAARQQTAPERELAGEMVSIPAGTFQMGDLSGEGHGDERPVHSVTVPAFKLGKYEVTVSQFRGFLEVTGYRMDAEQNTAGKTGCWSRVFNNWGWVPGRGWRNPGYPVHDEQAVVCVSWNDAQAFITWLNGKTGGNYRLPTEAEWEYAARATVINARCPSTFRCADAEWEYPAPATVESGCYGNWWSCPPNAWGLHDMRNSVSEWVQDCWNDSYEGAPTDGSAWTTGDCSLRIVRGDSWANLSWDQRFAYRLRFDRLDRGANLGFRLARDE